MQLEIIGGAWHPPGGPRLPDHESRRRKSERTLDSLELLKFAILIDQRLWDWDTHPQEFLEVASKYSLSPIFALAQECNEQAHQYNMRKKQALLKLVEKEILDHCTKIRTPHEAPYML